MSIKQDLIISLKADGVENVRAGLNELIKLLGGMDDASKFTSTGMSKLKESFDDIKNIVSSSGSLPSVSGIEDQINKIKQTIDSLKVPDFAASQKSIIGDNSVNKAQEILNLKQQEVKEAERAAIEEERRLAIIKKQASITKEALASQKEVSIESLTESEKNKLAILEKQIDAQNKIREIEEQKYKQAEAIRLAKLNTGVDSNSPDGLKIEKDYTSAGLRLQKAINDEEVLITKRNSFIANSYEKQVEEAKKAYKSSLEIVEKNIKEQNKAEEKLRKEQYNASQDVINQKKNEYNETVKVLNNIVAATKKSLADGLKEEKNASYEKSKLLKQEEKQRIGQVSSIQKVFSTGSGMASMFGVRGTMFSGLGQAIKNIMGLAMGFKLAIIGIGVALGAYAIAKKIAAVALEVGKLTLKLAGFEGAFSISGFVGKIQEITDTTRALKAQSDQIGISIDQTLIFSKAMERSGLEADSFSKRIAYLGKEITKAYLGNAPEVIQVLNVLKLDIVDLLSMEPEEYFVKIGTAIAELKSPAQQAHASMLLFERQGTMMIPMFKEMAGKIKEAKNVLGQMPATLEKNKLLFADISNNFRDLKVRGQQFFSGFVSESGGGLNGLLLKSLGKDLTELGAQKGREFAPAFRKAAEGDLGGAFSDALKFAIDNLSEFFEVFVDEMTKAIAQVDFSPAFESAAKATGKAGGNMMVGGLLNVQNTLEKIPTSVKIATGIGPAAIANSAIANYARGGISPSEKADSEKQIRYREELLAKKKAEKAAADRFGYDSLDIDTGTVSNEKNKIDYASIDRLKKSFKDTKNDIDSITSSIGYLNSAITKTDVEKRSGSLDYYKQQKDYIERAIKSQEQLKEADYSFAEQADKEINSLSKQLDSLDNTIINLEIQVKWDRNGFEQSIENITTKMEDISRNNELLAGNPFIPQVDSISEQIKNTNELIFSQKELTKIYNQSREAAKDLGLVEDQKKFTNAVRNSEYAVDKLNNAIANLNSQKISIQLENQMQATSDAISQIDANISKLSGEWNSLNIYDPVEQFEKLQGMRFKKIELLNTDIQSIDEALSNPSFSEERKVQLRIDRESMVREINSIESEIELEIDPKFNIDNLLKSLTRAFKDLKNEFGTLQENLSSSFTSCMEGMRDGLSDFLFDVGMGAKSSKDALSEVWLAWRKTALRAITDTIANFVMSKTVMVAMEMAFSAACISINAATNSSLLAQETATAAVITAAWTVPSILKSIATCGIAVAVGLAAMAAVMAIGGGFASGGRVPGGKQLAWFNEVGSEYVVSANSPRENDYYLDYANKGGSISDLTNYQSNVKSNWKPSGDSDRSRDKNVTNVTVNTRSQQRAIMKNAGVIRLVKDNFRREGLI